MIPDQIFLTGLGKLVYIGLYVPMSMVLAWATYRLVLRRLENTWLRRLAIALVVATIGTAPLWDVYAIGVEAKRLCREQAGLHVYRTVEADGFLGDSSIEIWSKYGFEYVESGGTTNRKYRYSIHEGKAMGEEVNEFESRYQAKTGNNFVVVGRYFSKSSERVVDRDNGEVIGELVYFLIFPGWFDNIVIALSGTGSGFAPWHCGNEPAPGSDILRLGVRELVLATIKPRIAPKEKAK